MVNHKIFRIVILLSSLQFVVHTSHLGGSNPYMYCMAQLTCSSTNKHSAPDNQSIHIPGTTRSVSFGAVAHQSPYRLKQLVFSVDLLLCGLDLLVLFTEILEK